MKIASSAREAVRILHAMETDPRLTRRMRAEGIISSPISSRTHPILVPESSDRITYPNGRNTAHQPSAMVIMRVHPVLWAGTTSNKTSYACIRTTRTRQTMPIKKAFLELRLGTFRRITFTTSPPEVFHTPLDYRANNLSCQVGPSSTPPRSMITL